MSVCAVSHVIHCTPVSEAITLAAEETEVEEVNMSSLKACVF